MLEHYVRRTLTRKRRFAGKHLVRDHAKRINIGSRVRFVRSRTLLGCEIGKIGRTKIIFCAARGHWAVRSDTGKLDVQILVRIFEYKRVLGCKISMNETVLMNGGETRRRLPCDLEGRVSLEPARFLQHTRKRFTVVAFVDRVNNAVGGRAEIDHIQDVRMGYLRCGLRLFEKTTNDLIIDGEGTRNYPQRYRTVHEYVPAVIDIAYLPSSDQLSDLIFFCQVFPFEFSGHLLLERLVSIQVAKQNADKGDYNPVRILVNVNVLKLDEYDQQGKKHQ